MASTSTGFNKSLVLHRMPTSSGQTVEFSSGCKLNMKVNSEIEMESGSTLNIESGGVIKVAAGGAINLNATGAILRRVVSLITTAPAKQKVGYSGFSYLTSVSTKTNSASTKFRIFITQPPYGGLEKKILIRNCTYVIEICASSSKLVEFATSGGKDYSMVIAPTTKEKDCGVMINLVSLSSKMWHLGWSKSPVVSTSSKTKATMVTLTSSTCKA